MSLKQGSIEHMNTMSLIITLSVVVFLSEQFKITINSVQTFGILGEAKGLGESYL